MAYVEYGQSLNNSIYLCRPESKRILRTRHGEMFAKSKHEPPQLVWCLPFRVLSGWNCLEECGWKRLASRTPERNDTYLISVNIQQAQEFRVEENNNE